MDIKYKINVAKDFSPYPAGRYRTEGLTSGEIFLADHLMGKFLTSVYEKSVLEIDLTGTTGFPSSFISGSFGKLSFEMGKLIGQKEATTLILKHIKFLCNDSSAKIKAYEEEIKNPTTKK